MLNLVLMRSNKILFIKLTDDIPYSENGLTDYV
jgi:hypothetical protein